MSFQANVLAVTNEKGANLEKIMFENKILPNSIKKIEKAIQVTKFFIPEMYNEFITRLLNIIVEEAKNYNFRLKRVGQSEEHILSNQLEFVMEKGCKH